MNEIFTKLNSERIELTDGYVLLPDGFNGIVLQRETEKIRTKKDKTEEKYIHTETIFQPTISKTLTRYLQLTTSEAKSIEELRDIVLRVEDKINQIKEVW
jgi:hypothetical protein